MFPMAGEPVVQFALTQEKLQQTMDMGPAPIDIPAPAGWAQTQEGPDGRADEPDGAN